MPEQQDERTDPSLDSDEDVTSPVQCEVCGIRFDPTDWHPVATCFDEADEFHLYVFCSVNCRNEW